jgi:hypothetical protein
MDLEQLTRRLVMAEQEITRAHAEIDVIRRKCQRLGRMRALASVALLVAGVGLAGVMSSATTQAQGPARPMTVRAPFVVVDGAGKKVAEITDGALRGLVISNAGQQPILTAGVDAQGGLLIVRDKTASYGVGIQFQDGEPEIVARGSDNKRFLELARAGANIRGPFNVTDNAEKVIVTVQDATASVAKGNGTAVTMPRGLHVLNAKAQVVARVAADKDGRGYVLVKDASEKGASAIMLVDKNGSGVAMSNANGKVVTDVSSKDGLVLFNDAGDTLTELNKTHLWLGADGVGLIEAGVLPDGRGVVRAGPRTGGPLGMGTLSLPYAIVGHK